MEPVYWLIAVAVLIVIELMTLGLTTIWFAGGAFVAFIAGQLQAPLWLQLALFFVVSVVLLIFTRPIAEKHLNASRTKTNVDSLIGKHGRVIEEIDNLGQTGKVMLDGMEWMARSETPDEKIPSGTVIEVRKVKGAHIVAAPAEEK